MASRYLFGYTSADFAVTVGSDGALKVAPGVTGTVYGSLSGGSAITDLLNVDSTPITQVTADADGRVAFYGPAGVGTVFVDFGDGRFRMDAADAASGGTPEVAFWSPSDPTGATDLTSELESFQAANPGRTIRVASGSTIKLSNAFASVTTGDILLDFTGVTVLYPNTGTAAIVADNTANASAEVAVSAIGMTTVNTDAYVTQLTLGATLAAAKFDWLAFYGSDANPAIAGGYLGEIVQVLNNEASLSVALTRRLNRHAQYATSLKARKLSAARRLVIRGGTFKASGNTEDLSITTRSAGIKVLGWVDPLIENVTFDHPWSQCIWLQCNAAPKARNIQVRDVGNLANSQGYTYGVMVYGMNDAADIRDVVVRNGRHPAFTTDGNSSSSTTWWQRGIPTNAVVDGVHGINCHGSVIDTHEEGDNITFLNVVADHSYQDADISGSFTGTAAQLRAANVVVRGLTITGGTRGVKVPAVDHGFEDRLVLDGLRVHRTTSAADTDIGVQIDDQSALANKRHVVIRGEFDNVGTAVVAGKKSKVTFPQAEFRRCRVGVDAGAGSDVLFTGAPEFDFRNTTRATPYQPILARSDGANGGCSVVSMNPVQVIKGATSSPAVLVVEADTTATKKLWIPRVYVFDPNSSGVPAVVSATQATFDAANVFDLDGFFADNGNPGNPGDGDGTTPTYPQSLLPAMSSFKLTLPTGSGTSPDEVFQPALATFSDASWFHLNTVKDGVEMAANCGGTTTGASSYARSEFREMQPNSTTEAGWGANDGKIHTLTTTQVITQLPVARPILITAQIHPDGPDNFLFIVADGFHPTSGTTAVTGTNTTIGFNIYCKTNDASGAQAEYIPILTGYKLGQTFSTKIEVLDNKVNVYCDLGTTASTLKATITANIPTVNDLYFKTGCYLQSNTTNTGKTVPSGLTTPTSGQPTGGDSPTAGGKVVMKALAVTHVTNPGTGPGPGTGGPGATYPADLTGPEWKITKPDATEVKQPAFATFTDSSFLLNSTKSGVIFNCRCNGATTPNTTNPRSELREMTGSPAYTTNAAWTALTGSSVKHTMIYTASVDELPVKKPEVVVGQIHAVDDPPDDQLVVLASGFYPSTGTVAVTGTNTSIGFDLRIRWLGSTKLGGSFLPVLIPNLHIGEKFSVKFEVTGNRYRIWAMKDPTGAQNFTGVPEATAAVNLTLSYTGANYFKLGVYVQSNLSNSGKTVPTGTCSGGADLTTPPAGASTGGDAATAGGKVTIYGTPTITHT